MAVQMLKNASIALSGKFFLNNNGRGNEREEKINETFLMTNWSGYGISGH